MLYIRVVIYDLEIIFLIYLYNKISQDEQIDHFL